MERPRKALGRIHGLAVRFGEPDAASTLLVGEGIETVLSLVTALPDTVAAAALSAGTLVAVTGSKPVENAQTICTALDHVHGKYPDMVLVYVGNDTLRYSGRRSTRQ